MPPCRASVPSSHLLTLQSGYVLDWVILSVASGAIRYHVRATMSVISSRVRDGGFSFIGGYLRPQGAKKGSRYVLPCLSLSAAIKLLM